MIGKWDYIDFFRDEIVLKSGLYPEDLKGGVVRFRRARDKDIIKAKEHVKDLIKYLENILDEKT